MDAGSTRVYRPHLTKDSGLCAGDKSVVPSGQRISDREDILNPPFSYVVLRVMDRSGGSEVP